MTLGDRLYENRKFLWGLTAIFLLIGSGFAARNMYLDYRQRLEEEQRNPRAVESTYEVQSSRQ